MANKYYLLFTEIELELLAEALPEAQALVPDLDKAVSYGWAGLESRILNLLDK